MAKESAEERNRNGVIWQENENIFVKYTTRDGDKKINNSHPVDIDAMDIHAMLAAVHVEKRKNKQEPLFSADQQIILSQQIAAGLRSGRPDQDIVFALQREESTLAGLKIDHYFVAGRVFYANDHLNLIIGDYERPRNRAYEMAYDPTNRGLVKYTFNMGSREQDKYSFDEKLVFHASNISFEEQSNRNDWLQFDMDNVDAQATMANSEAVSEPDEYSAAAAPVSQTYVAPQPSVQVNAAPESVDNSLINRFKTLEALRKDGLISEQEYERKRKALLDEL
jgi:hypothetical protein